MSIEIKWNEDKTEATISKDDLATLQGSFDKGFGKGSEAGRKEILKEFAFLELDEANLSASITPYKQQLLDIKSGKFPEELMKKLKDTDLVKDLQTKLQEKSSAFENLSSDMKNLKVKHLIDNKLLELGATDGHKAVDAKAAAQLFKNDFKIEIGEADTISIKNENGNAIFNENGDELTLPDVYKKFAQNRPFLFEANGSGGSGGGNNEAGGGKTMLKSEFDNLSAKEQAKEMDSGTILTE